MGTWGSGPFQNDTASDWVYDLEDADDLTLALDALERVRATEYVDAEDATVAIAAAEVVAAAGGRPHADLPPEVEAWLGSASVDVEPWHAERAAGAIERIRGDDSELAELWAESDEADWRASLDDLTARLEH